MKKIKALLAPLTGGLGGLPWAAIIRVAITILGVLTIAWHFGVFNHAKQEAARARGQEVVATATTGAAKSTIKIIETQTAEGQRVDRVTKENTDVILASPGALQAIDPAVHRAGLVALCLHDDQRDARCAAVLHGDDSEPRPAGPGAAR